MSEVNIRDIPSQIMFIVHVLSGQSSSHDTTLSRLVGLLEHHGTANAVLLGTMIDEAGCS